MLRRILLVASIIPALAAGMMGVARAQTDGQSPSVIVRPVGTTKDAPNAGQWFVTNLSPGETKQIQMQIINPAAVAQTVKLYLADIRFDRQGVPQVANEPIDIGTWGRFENATVTVGAQQTIVQSFSITAPGNADPGDHVGAVVAEHAPEGAGNIRSIKRVAVRLYATLPGDARRDFVIDGVDTQKDSAFYTRELTVNVRLRNTGRVRLEPTVRVDGVPAKGPDLLMSHATETYITTESVPFWGGPIRMRVDAETRLLGTAGPARQLRVTVWVIPWHLLATLVVAAGLVLLGRWALRKRGRRYRALQEDLRRMERLLAMTHAGSNGDDEPPGIAGDDASAVMRAALKQARRAGDARTAERLERALGRRR